MSVSTPIRMTPSLTCACAAPHPSAKASTLTLNRCFIAFLPGRAPVDGRRSCSFDPRETFVIAACRALKCGLRDLEKHTCRLELGELMQLTKGGEHACASVVRD